ncbi:MAG: FmdE family protein [Archaeoglobaceae archaeon]
MSNIENEILEHAKQFHGHLCPGVALGIRASSVAMKKLGIERAGVDESVEESILAIVECNNCLVDGVQLTTGCTLGNNTLVFCDLGKNALSIVRRENWEGVRVYSEMENIRSDYFSPEARDLFEKVVVNREGTDAERERLASLWEDISWRIVGLPEEAFSIKPVTIKPIEQAPIFGNIRCANCNEVVMEPRSIECSDGERYCLSCCGEEYFAVTGRGIIKRK